MGKVDVKISSFATETRRNGLLVLFVLIIGHKNNLKFKKFSFSSIKLYSIAFNDFFFRETSKFPGDIGRKARDLIGLLLQKNPRNRLRMNQILEHSWFSNSPKTPSS